MHPHCLHVVSPLAGDADDPALSFLFAMVTLAQVAEHLILS